MKDIFQQSLFPSRKGEFEPDAFKRAISDTPFIECVRDGMNDGFNRMRKVFYSGDMSMRNESNFLHEAVFNGIKTQIGTNMPEYCVDFANNRYGSERLFFTFKNYTFILRINGAKTNDTKPSLCIEHQEADNHILILEYTLDEMRTSIQSASFLYKKGKSSIYAMSIPLHKSIDIAENIQEDTVEVKKPILKVRKKEAK